MISNFFVLSPRGDTILAKQYRTGETATSHGRELGAHERSHTEAFFRTLKFWKDDADENKEMSDHHPEMLTSVGSMDHGAENNAPTGATTATGAGGSGGGTATKRTAGGDAPPVLIMPDGLTYFHVKRNGLVFGASSARNVSPNTVIELLSTIARIFKDYCGTLTEEALRRNFVLCYELLDEMLDYGYPQVTRTENLKSFVYNEPILVEVVPNTADRINPKTASASAVHKPVIAAASGTGRGGVGGAAGAMMAGKGSAASAAAAAFGGGGSSTQKNEIFVDILERLNVVFSNNGYVLNSTIDGCIQMKSYLAGNPELRLALNEDLMIGKNAQATNPKSYYGSSGSGGPMVTVDDMNFHHVVNLTEFESSRTLSFIPPDGEFVVLNYRLTGDMVMQPFRIFPSLEETEPNKIEMTVLIRAEMPQQHFGANVVVEIPLPAAAISATCSLVTAPGTAGAHAEFLPGKILWQMKKFPAGGSEQSLKAKISLNRPCTTTVRRQVGPIHMSFEIPMYSVSNLQVRYLRVADQNMVGYSPYRWVRYVTQSNSYVCRF